MDYVNSEFVQTAGFILTLDKNIQIIQNNSLCLTSDAHVDVLVLVEVVVLELVHVVLGHAGVVMQLELEMLCY